ncbi:LysE family translocator [Rhizobium paknamense]|uniref:Threonine/homoserine/homoserine lactone efflux protein n=1 Tax=Rhizobium paknamense TaxID=1206817 RepID=A0ABU0IAF2_9HYPH|nr:LysE family translocator [Rhizobium paknamense]MDQ0455204.1 threonine/homoserine/homoserine lactone efflux protein [Rhizobium paknamense]
MADLWIYVLACLAIVAIPGPAVIYILSRTVEGGFGAGVLSASGIAVGALGNALASAFGLSLLFAAFPASLYIIKYIGAAYLLYLAWKTLRSGGGNQQSDIPKKQYFVQGVIVSLLNPKVTLFFAAFLPAFIHPEEGYFLQASRLAVIFVVIAFVFDLLTVLTSGLTREFFLKSAGADSKLFKYLSALCLVLVAGFAAH